MQATRAGNSLKDRTSFHSSSRRCMTNYGATSDHAVLATEPPAGIALGRAGTSLEERRAAPVAGPSPKPNLTDAAAAADRQPSGLKAFRNTHPPFSRSQKAPRQIDG